MRSFLILGFTLSCACTSDRLESAELQSKCASSAKASFDAAYGQRNLTNYTNHYNRKLGMCLMRIRSTSAEFDLLYSTDEVLDVHEHRTIAHDFSQTQIRTQEATTICYLDITARKDCGHDEYDKAAKALMTE